MTEVEHPEGLQSLKRKYAELLLTTADMVSTLHDLKRRKVVWKEKKKFLLDKLIQYEQAHPNLLGSSVGERANRMKKGAPQCTFSHGNMTCKFKAMVGSRFCSTHSASVAASTNFKLCEHKDSSGRQCPISIPRNANSKYCPAHKQLLATTTGQATPQPPSTTLQRIQPHMVNPAGYVYNRSIPPTSTQPPATTTVPPPPATSSKIPATSTKVSTTPSALSPVKAGSTPATTLPSMPPYNPLYQQQQLMQQQMLYQKQLYMKNQGINYPQMAYPGTFPPPQNPLNQMAQIAQMKAGAYPQPPLTGKLGPTGYPPQHPQIQAMQQMQSMQMQHPHMNMPHQSQIHYQVPPKTGQ